MNFNQPSIQYSGSHSVNTPMTCVVPQATIKAANNRKIQGNTRSRRSLAKRISTSGME